jgi:ketosteroid isomerase-like protein
MSQENVELVAGVYEAFARRDDAAPFEVYATDIEWDTSRSPRAAAPSFTAMKASASSPEACSPRSP